MPVLAGQALLILYREEKGLALVEVEYMDIHTPVHLAPLFLPWDMVIHTMVGGVAGAGLHPIGTPGQHLMPGCGAYTQVAGDRDAGGASSDAESELDSTKKRLEELKKLGGEENA